MKARNQIDGRDPPAEQVTPVQTAAQQGNWALGRQIVEYDMSTDDDQVKRKRNINNGGPMPANWENAPTWRPPLPAPPPMPQQGGLVDGRSPFAKTGEPSPTPPRQQVSPFVVEGCAQGSPTSFSPFGMSMDSAFKNLAAPCTPSSKS